MAELDIQPRKTLRGTWKDILEHQDEISALSEVEVRIFGAPPAPDPSIALLESWIAAAPTDEAAIREAEEDLLEFKRQMNQTRRDAGARLLYPEAE